tara:strand:- start:311 stop:925 length:615 start_codon:yes stop_codon:yes gene_type:complete
MIKPIFSPWYARAKIKDMEENNKKLYDKIYNNFNEAQLVDLPWNCSVWTTFRSQENNHLFRHEINLCASKVVEPIVAIAEELGHKFNKLQIDSWFNAYKDFQWQEFHHHLPSVISGVYFISYDPKTHGKLVFKNPLSLWKVSQVAEIRYNPSIKDLLMQDDFIPDIEEGDLIVFPSGLRHAVKIPNKKSDKLRITFSFNVTYKE